jgi:putative ABC transport system ATP-binding protein
VSEPIIQLSDVTKVYGSGSQATAALRNLTLDIAAGQFVSLMGPSGSGKSTLLNLIAGLDVPDSGRVRVDGHDLAALPDHRLADLRLKRIGFVFQAFNLIPVLTAAENVAWPLEFSGCSRAAARTRALDALRRVGVEERHARYPGELSGGEQQRVAIARAVATAPAILLADEPTGNLDSLAGQGILDLLRGLNDSDHVTVVMVTHNALAATWGDRTLELHDGRIVRDVRTPPRSRLGRGGET